MTYHLSASTIQPQKLNLRYIRRKRPASERHGNPAPVSSSRPDAPTGRYHPAVIPAQSRLEMRHQG
jgi:hypothetical protein